MRLGSRINGPNPVVRVELRSKTPSVRPPVYMLLPGSLDTDILTHITKDRTRHDHSLMNPPQIARLQISEIGVKNISLVLHYEALTSPKREILLVQSGL